MKKIFIFIFLAFPGISAISQPVITTDYTPVFGDMYVFKIVDDTATAQPGQSGAGVIWNLASMHGQLSTRQYNWVQTALTNDAVIFGTNSNLAAEIIQNGFSPRYEFFNVGSNFGGDMKKVGSHVDFAITNFGAGYMRYDYPMSYGQSATDTMIGSTGVAYVNGRSTTTYDGYGTLQLEAQSGGNFANVARIKVDENYIVDYGPIETHHATTYYWFDNQYTLLRKQPIAIIYIHEWVDLGGSNQREKYALLRQILFQNEVPQFTLTPANVSVSPNPFRDRIRFSLPGIDTDIRIELSDMTGRVVKNHSVEKSSARTEETLLLSDLPDGIYLARITSEKGTVVRKIVKG